VINLETAKIFMNGKSQAVRLPKSCRFNCEEVSIKKVGDIVLLYRADKALENFLQSEPITDDVLSAILDARKEDSRHAANHPDNREQI
jgi:antitoxin VapB